MADKRAAPLDEVQYLDHNVLGYWQGVHANSVHGYLSESPFFDHTSKNGVLWGQALNDPSTLALYSDRQRLEATLRQRPGTEYMIVGEPQPVKDPTLGPDTGVWVIRKQDRAKRGQAREDEVTTLGTYYITGEHMYQAPSVYDVVGNHLLSVMNSLSQFMEEAAPLPQYAPATGYSWFGSEGQPGPSKTIPLTQTSREQSPGPDASQSASSLDRPTQGSQQSAQQVLTHDPRDTALLEESLRLTLAYGDEFMDENPLRGEPGNFVFTYTKDLLKTRQKEAEAAAAKAKAKAAMAAAAASNKAAAPAAFTTTIKDEHPAVHQQQQQSGGKRKSSKVDGKRRRKSRAALSVSAAATPSAMPSPEGA